MNVHAYAEFQRWLGRGPALQGMWDAWAAGDRKGALAAIPDEVVDDLVVHGSFAQCRATIKRYMDNGVTIPALAVSPWASTSATPWPPSPLRRPELKSRWSVTRAGRQTGAAPQSVWSGCAPSAPRSACSP